MLFHSTLPLAFMAFVCIANGLKQYKYEPIEAHPDHPGKCYWEPTNTAYAVNERFTDPNACELLKCQPNQIVRISCDERRGSVQAGCSRRGPDLSKAYPECCPQVVCAPVKIEY